MGLLLLKSTQYFSPPHWSSALQWFKAKCLSKKNCCSLSWVPLREQKWHVLIFITVRWSSSQAGQRYPSQSQSQPIQHLRLIVPNCSEPFNTDPTRPDQTRLYIRKHVYTKACKPVYTKECNPVYTKAFENVYTKVYTEAFNMTSHDILGSLKAYDEEMDCVS